MMWPDLKEDSALSSDGWRDDGRRLWVQSSAALQDTVQDKEGWRVGDTFCPSCSSRVLICDVTEEESRNNVAGTRCVGPRVGGSGC